MCDYGAYQNYRTATRHIMEGDHDLQDQIPFDSQHYYQNPSGNRHYNHHHHHHHHHHHREESTKRRQFTRSLSNTDPPADEKTGKNFFLKRAAKNKNIF